MPGVVMLRHPYVSASKSPVMTAIWTFPEARVWVAYGEKSSSIDKGTSAKSMRYHERCGTLPTGIISMSTGRPPPLACLPLFWYHASIHIAIGKSVGRAGRFERLWAHRVFHRGRRIRVKILPFISHIQFLVSFESTKVLHTSLARV